MLAKVWKKVLLAICILACIYNVMHKLLSRTSLEFQLESVKNQSSIIDMLNTNTTNTTQETQKPSVSEEKTNSVNLKENTNSTTQNISNNTIVVIY